MTTPRDDDARYTDDETRVDVSVTRSSGSESEHRPSAFPSVGGTPAGADREPSSGPPPFAPVSEGPAILPAFASTDGAAGPVLTAPVGGRNSRWRWFAAAVATLIVVAMIGGFLAFLGPRPGTPSLVSRYVPADAALYAELRLDLPGDQRDRLVSFMSNFPGFADPATFQQKIDDTLQQLVSSADAGLDWKQDVDPWFGGQLAFYQSTQASSLTHQPINLVMEVKDRQKLQDIIDARMPEATATQRDHEGFTVWTVMAPDMSREISFTVTDDALLVAGTFNEIETVLDVKAGVTPALVDQAFFLEQQAGLHSDRLATFYYDYSSFLGSVPLDPTVLPDECMQSIRAATNSRMLGEVRAETDHLAVTARSQIPAGGNLPPAVANKPSTLAESVPADALAYVEFRQAGALVKFGVAEGLRCLTPALGGFDTSQLDQLLGVAPQDYFDFVGDAAIAFTSTSGKLGGGLIATVDDENVARIRVERLLSAVRLAAMAGGLTIEEQEHGGATITVIRLGEDMLPSDVAQSISVTVSGGRLYLGVDDFVTAALDRAAGDSLASAPRLQDALAAVGHENAGVVYLDLGALRAVAESNMPAESRTSYDTEVKPFLEPITNFVVVNRIDGGINVSHAFLYVE